MLAKSPARRGGLTLEMLLLLPVLLAVVVAAVEFALLVEAEVKLEKAVALAGRVASQGGDDDVVRAAILASLSDGRWKAVKVEVRPEHDRQKPLHSGCYIEVLATIPATDVVPDMLSFVGVSLKGEKVRARALVRKE